MCFDYDGGHPRLFRQDWHKARKQHLCCECCLPICPGESYELTFGVWEGEAATYKTCRVCHWFRERVGAAEMEHGCHAHEATPAFGFLLEALADGHDGVIGLFDLDDYHEDAD